MIKILLFLKKKKFFLFKIGIFFLFLLAFLGFMNFKFVNPTFSFPIESPQNKDLLEISSDNFTISGERITVKGDPRTTAVISWNSKGFPSDPKVYYGETKSLGSVKNASIYTLETGYLSSIELTKLKPNTIYHYQVQSDPSHKGEIMSFRTAPERNSTSLRFLVWGDTRTDRSTRNEIAQKAAQLKSFSFNIHSGDIVSDGLVQELWDNYFNDTKEVHAFHQSYFIAGNHEWSSFPSQTLMYNNIPMPSNARDSTYYSFNYGPISFLGLDTNDQITTPYIPMNLQWLETELRKFEADNHTLWKIAFFHEPIFNSMPSRLDREDLKTTWYSFFNQYNLDIIFVGHNHYYERTYPINQNGEFNISQDPNYINPQYPIQIISGGAGAPLYDRGGNNPSYSAYFNSTYHFCIVDISNDFEYNNSKLTLETWAMNKYSPQNYSDLFLIDKITITKDLPEKYLNTTYISPIIDEFIPKPEWFYYLADIAIVVAILIFVDLPIFYRYGKLWKKRINDRIINISNEKLKIIISTVFYIVISIGIFYILVGIDIIEISSFNLYLGFISSLLPLSILNGILWRKNGFTSTFGLFLNSVVSILFIYLFLFEPELFINNVILISVFLIIGMSLLIGSMYLSKNIKISKLSNRESFLLGGNLLFIGNLITILTFIKLFSIVI